MPTLCLMHEEVSVLLLSVGENPNELKAELERLGVRVVECEFLDAEETIADESPDLVVLGGSRGAMELATLLDDQEGDHRPRMVIVAERKDLAKLRGLNREVVISLFALETTEKVVGQRVESLARRAARRRSQANAPPAPPVKKTSLGLPSAHAVVGQVALKKAAAPSPPGIKIEEKAVEEAPPPPTRSSQENAERPEPPRRSVLQAASETSSGQQRAGTAFGPTLSSAGTPRASNGESTEDILMSDEDLLSLPPSEPPEGNIELAKMPVTPGLPVIEGVESESSSDSPVESSSPVSIPPTLPPEAKEKSPSHATSGNVGHPVSARQSKRQTSEDEFDISDAEAALENLDSSKAEITASLLKDAQAFLSEPVVPQNSSSAAESAEDEGVAGVEAAIDSLGSTVPAVQQASVVEAAGKEAEAADAEATGDGPDQKDADEVKANGTASLEKEADERTAVAEDAVVAENTAAAENAESSTTPSATDDGPRAEETDETSVGELASPEASLTPEQPVSLEPSVSPGLSVPAAPEVRKGGKGLLLVALVALGLGGAYYSGVFQEKEHEAAPTAAPHAKQQGDKLAAVENARAPDASAEEQPEAAAPSPSDSDTHARVENLEAKPEAASSGALTGQKSAPLADPFLIEDANLPGCETLVGSKPQEAETDAVYQASVVWQEARQLIVSGKLKDANLKMCEAVALNPESAAVEGLAALYLRLKSPKEALKWVERADALRPGQSEMGYVRGDIYSLLGRSQEARTVWLKTLNIPEDDSSRIEAVSKDYSVEAGRHLRRGDLVRADQWFRRAVTLDPKNIAGIIGLAKTFHKDGDASHARAFCEMSLEVSDEIPEVHVMLGELALADGDKAGARVRFERALAVRPDFFPAKRGLSQVK